VLVLLRPRVRALWLLPSAPPPSPTPPLDAHQLPCPQPHLGGDTGWCLSTTEADLFAVWLTLGNIVHGEPKKIFFISEKSTVAFLAGLPMGFAWYIKLWAAPVGPPGGQRSDISTPHAHGMGLWAGGALAWCGPPRTAGPGASPAMRPLRGPPAAAPNQAGTPPLGPNPGLARGQAARARLVSPPHRQYRQPASSSRLSRDKICRFVIARRISTRRGPRDEMKSAPRRLSSIIGIWSGPRPGGSTLRLRDSWGTDSLELPVLKEAGAA
jgi:hypothetical protein